MGLGFGLGFGLIGAGTHCVSLEDPGNAMRWAEDTVRVEVCGRCS